MRLAGASAGASAAPAAFVAPEYVGGAGSHKILEGSTNPTSDGTYSRSVK